MATYTVKGSHIVQAKLYIDGLLGADAFARLSRQAGGDVTWDSPSVSSWYDALILQQVMSVVAHETQRPMLELATEIARNNASVDLKGIYRAFLRIAQPVRMLYFTPQLWRNYVSFGDAEAVVNLPGSLRVQLRGVPERLLDWAAGCSLGFLPTGIELAGGVIRHAEVSERIAAGDASQLEIAVDYRIK